MLKPKFKVSKRGLCTALVLLGIGLGYYIFTEITHLYIPCVFHIVTGLNCPGCGVTRFIVSLLHFDFRSAVSQNLALAGLLPVWLIYGAFYIFLPEKLGDRTKPFKILTIGSVILLVIFGILRNIPMFSFLAPGRSGLIHAAIFL